MKIASCAATLLRRGRAFSSAPAPVAGGKLYICGTGEYNKLGVGDVRRNIRVAMRHPRPTLAPRACTA